MAIAVTLALAGCNFIQPAVVADPSRDLTVHFINIGQGAATLLQGPDFTILIDAGRPDGDEVVPYLEKQRITSLDLLVGTHPRADHIGQMSQVLEAFPVREVWMSGGKITTRTFERALDAIEASKAGYHEPRAGEIFVFGSAQIQVMSPGSITGHLNNDSVVLLVRFRDVVFLFPGDAEGEAEALLAQDPSIRSQVLQLGHHGSSTSSSALFLSGVRPDYAVYSASADNPYGYPHEATLQNLAALGVRVFGTDVHGTVRIVTEGTTIRVETERQGEPKPGRQRTPALEGG